MKISIMIQILIYYFFLIYEYTRAKVKLVGCFGACCSVMAYFINNHEIVKICVDRREAKCILKENTAKLMENKKINS